ncbi:hypothetical protein [Roseivirga misakiensis]|uniref:Lipocalin-like domain-containing protein n=1 Tax=Roseivirga misakiensis TaxID=1563681 RepID=A0A1E5SZ25_9BACT|nr:hypothetical protein [Roseivirga misakiensis]OEK04371.1 hypothetical protein BFP71_12880 [Roseivirga misakiensis]
MKMLNPTKAKFSIILLLIFILGCGSSESKKESNNESFDPIGEWEYKVTTDVSYGVITISEQGNSYAASMTTEVFGTLELMNLSLEGTTLTGDLNVGGTPATIKCEFDGNEFTGLVSAGETKFPMVGHRAN